MKKKLAVVFILLSVFLLWAEDEPVYKSFKINGEEQYLWVTLSTETEYDANENEIHVKVNGVECFEEYDEHNQVIYYKSISDNGYNWEIQIASRFVRNFIEKSRSNQAAFCSFSHSIFCSRRVSALM